MKSSIWWSVVVVLVSAGLIPQVGRGQTEPRLVSEEFHEKLSHVATRSLSPPEALDFPPHRARFVRIAILKTSGASQPGIDELEIYGPDNSENLALAQRGAIATASSLLPGYAIHQIHHLNDGRYGNDFSWIAAARENQWVQIELAEEAQVSRIIVTRDRTGRFTDRIPEAFEVLISQDGRQWQTVARRDRTAAGQSRRLPYLPIDRLPETSWDGFLHYTFQRERTTWINMDANDHLSPLVTDRPAVPGGEPYWGRLARREPLDRVLFLFEQMTDRLEAKGVDVGHARRQATGFRRQALEVPDCQALYLEARLAKRTLFFCDPDLAPLERILFAKRHPFLESHNYSEHLDGIMEPGGGVYVLNIPRDSQGRFRPDRAVVQQLFDGSDGIVREPTADYDAQNVYFAYRPDQSLVDGWDSYWHLHTMRVDGSGRKQLTEGPYHDFDAVCLPDGGLAFHSTRCQVRFLCWRPQAYVLYRMEADGSQIRRLSYANLSEWKPSVMQDGRILWTRSEYLDKGADFGHTLWAIRPDGTHPELIFGNNTPNCYSQAHEVPGTNEIVCTLMSHGDHQGPIALIDRSYGPFDTAAITNITPDTRPHYQMSRSHHDSFRDPYPISSDHFLVAHNPDNQHLWCLYVIDRYGNRELLYADPTISSKRPSPLHPRTRPPVAATIRDDELAGQNLGQFTIQDVYLGLGASVVRGQARYLHVAEEVPATLPQLACGQYQADHPPFTDFYAAPVHLVRGPAATFKTRTPNALLGPLRTNHNWPDHVQQVSPGLYRVREAQGWPSYVAKASLGTVPIEDDGSVNFTAPAGRVLYFQLLDQHWNELQRMRSVVQLQAGERRSCVGCHEDRHVSPAREVGSALLQPPRSLQPPAWGSAAFDYQQVVQPVLDARCVSCHDGSQPGRSDLRGTLDNNRVPRSYRTLIEGGWVHYFDFTYGMRHFKAEPLSFGTLQSRLWTVLADKDHEQISLDPDELRAIKTWIHLNCPLWPDYQYRLDRPAE